MFLHIKNKDDGLIKKYEDMKRQYMDEKINIDNMKLELKREHEKSEEMKRQFFVNKDLYYKFKNEINNNKIFEIPELFKNEFLIFTNLEKNENLNSNNEIFEYIIQKNNLINNDNTNFNEIFKYNNNSDDSINSDDTN